MSGHLGQSQVEAGDCTAIHFIVLPVPAMHLDDGGFVTIGIGIRSRATERLGPISGLMHQRGALQGVTGALVAQLIVCH